MTKEQCNEELRKINEAKAKGIMSDEAHSKMFDHLLEQYLEACKKENN